jgi:hypothetical protein
MHHLSEAKTGTSVLVTTTESSRIATMAATNKCLAQSNKSRTGGEVTKG